MATLQPEQIFSSQGVHPKYGAFMLDDPYATMTKCINDGRPVHIRECDLKVRMMVVDYAATADDYAYTFVLRI